MSLQLKKVPQLVSVIIRHLSAYLELAASETADMGKALIKQLVLAVVALVCSVFAVAVACTWLIIAAWQTQWRYVSLAALLVVFVLGALASLMKLRHPVSSPAPFDRLRSEWRQDRELLEEMLHASHEHEAEQARAAVATPASGVHA